MVCEKKIEVPPLLNIASVCNIQCQLLGPARAAYLEDMHYWRGRRSPAMMRQLRSKPRSGVWRSFNLFAYVKSNSYTHHWPTSPLAVIWNPNRAFRRELKLKMLTDIALAPPTLLLLLFSNPPGDVWSSPIFIEGKHKDCILRLLWVNFHLIFYPSIVLANVSRLLINGLWIHQCTNIGRGLRCNWEGMNSE